MTAEELYRNRPVNVQELQTLEAEGVLAGPFELLEGVIYFGGEPLMFSPAQQARAAALGITVPSWFDAILADPAMRNEMRSRLD